MIFIKLNQIRLIAKTSTGRSFKGIFNYLLAPNKKAEILSSRCVQTSSKEELISNFNLGRLYNPKLGKCVWHTSISFSSDDSVTNERIIEISEEWLTLMGLAETQWVIIRHNDNDSQSRGPHIHIVLNRISDNGETLSDSNNWKRSEAVCRTLEKKYQLTPIPSMRNEQKINQERLKGYDAFKSECHLALQYALARSKNIEEFNLLMKEKNISCVWKYNPDGSPRGLSFEREKLKIKASDINRIYSAKHIQLFLERSRDKDRKQREKLEKKAIKELSYSANKLADINDEQYYDEGILKLDQLINSKQIKYGRKL